MPSYNEILQEISSCPQPHNLDYVRIKYVKDLSSYTHRNVICYYSGFLTGSPVIGSDINDMDINYLMANVYGLDKSKGLDLILHTPGGSIAATEAIVNYLRSVFGNDIRAIVPQICMSAGTMISCACKSIVMGNQSSIGPIDPQFRGVPAQGVLYEFEEAVNDAKRNPSSIPLWQTIINKYNPTLIGECQNAIELSKELVTEWLASNMFKDESDAKYKAENVVRKLNNHKDTKTHDRHINKANAQKIGLVIEGLEEDNTLQDLVLSIHHAYMITLSNIPIIKIVENQNGVNAGMVTNNNSQVPNHS